MRSNSPTTLGVVDAVCSEGRAVIGCATSAPLTVVVPFAKSDYRLALDLFAWMRELGGCGERRCLLVAANHITEDELRAARESASLSFAVVDAIRPPHPLQNEAWPRGANWLFVTAARHIESQRLGAWWWHEPDCLPLCPGWLDIMEEEYSRCRKPFMGVYVNGVTMKDRVVAPSFNGCAVYPEDAHTRFRNIDLVDSEAWDISVGRITVPNGHNAASIGHNWGKMGCPPTFREYHTKGEPENVLTLDNIPRTAVVFHRCKDGSLLRLLRSQTPGLLPEPRENEAFGDGAKSPKPRIVHVVERHLPVEPRLERAVASWKSIYATNTMEGYHVWKFPRTSSEVGDPRCLPYLKDLLAAGMKRVDDNDIVMVSNGDNLLHPRLPDLIRTVLDRVPCICSFRLNVMGAPNLSSSPAELASRSRPDFGRDLFAFRKSWLKSHWEEIPDFFVGEWEWDLVMALMIRRENGVPIISKSELSTANPQSELPLGYVLHEMHDRPWLTTHYHTSPSKRHNLDLANAWYSAHNLVSFQILP